MKHYTIAARAGDEKSLDQVKKGYKLGLMTKDDLANMLRYQNIQDEMKSDERDKASIHYASDHERQKEMKSDARDKITKLLAVARDDPQISRRY